MNNPVLQSENFDRAAYSLVNAFDSFRGTAGNFEEAVRLFARSVDKLQAIAGMQAENDSRRSRGLSPAYTENDFAAQ